MNIFSSASHAISSTFNAIGEIGDIAQESVQVGTQYVHNRASEQFLTDKAMVVKRTAAALILIDQDLDADAALKAKYNELLKDW